jgi:outer membrane protein assembly factor BamB
MTAISIKANSRGQVLWQKYYQPAPNNITLSITAVDPINRVIIMSDKETLQWSGYSLDNGNLLWGPTGTSRAWDYFSPNGFVAYGKLYSSGFGGILSCYDTKTGNLLWTYGNGGEGNSTFSGHEAPYGNYPLFVGAIADNKLYMFTSEHSPNAPEYKGALVRCLDAETGKEIWTTLSWANPGSFTSSGFEIADGFLIYLNTYDMQIYNIGKGPSSTTLSIQNDVIIQGNSILLKGTVTDISAGTKQTEQAGRFPNGVPAVSDGSESSWMQYVYMQKPRPADVTGVPVMLSVLDANGNYRTIGNTTSDANGFFSFAWMPDIPGQYTVYASFGGSESYWPSHAETAFMVQTSSTPTATTPQPQIALPPFEMYFAASTIAIIIAIVIIGLLILRKKP